MLLPKESRKKSLSYENLTACPFICARKRFSTPSPTWSAVESVLYAALALGSVAGIAVLTGRKEQF